MNRTFSKPKNGNKNILNLQKEARPLKDPRIETLAKNLISYSVELKRGEKVLIEVSGSETILTGEIIKQVYQAGGIPFVNIKSPRISRELLMGATEESIKAMASYDIVRMKDMKAYIGIYAADNVNEFSDVPPEKLKIFMEHYSKPVHSNIRVRNTKWCVLRYPTPSMAQMAEMSTEAFEDFYFNVCNLDYNKMSKAMDPLVELMEKTDKVKILGPGTNLSFSIKGIPAIKCDGKFNIPDGEVFTAPVRESVEGHITFNTPTVFQGETFYNIYLEFKKGRIIKATSDKTEKLNHILDTDKGARYIGEFAIGLNPYVEKPMKDTLFDEKIMGSFHLTPGHCYDESSNGNESAIHWDMVCIQRKEYGGGEIYFDDVLVRKDGIFVLDELKDLNPKALR